MLCTSLCVPAFASNNASSQKWVVVGERDMRNEMGTYSRYLHLTPYQGGEIFATTISSYVASLNTNPSSSAPEPTHFMTWLVPLNFPDWWRAALPLGNRAYIQFDSPQIVRNSTGSSISSFSVFAFSRSQASYFDFSVDRTKPTSSNSSDSLVVFRNDSPLFPLSSAIIDGSFGSSPYASGVSLQVGSSSLVYSLQDFYQLYPAFWSVSGSFSGFSYTSVAGLSNLSSDDLILGVTLPTFPASEPSYILTVSVAISFWVDANKLPAGLQVGDEFPANTDAFDQMRDTLIDQFPEASDNIENGKDTIQGWNDTETVDTDVASTSISALNAMFQNLGGFLFIISLMVFGAVVLRMLIRKAVDG
nr:MAG TPA: Protein C [Inoviridae sp.]